MSRQLSILFTTPFFALLISLLLFACQGKPQRTGEKEDIANPAAEQKLIEREAKQQLNAPTITTEVTMEGKTEPEAKVKDLAVPTEQQLAVIIDRLEEIENSINSLNRKINRINSNIKAVSLGNLATDQPLELKEHKLLVNAPWGTMISINGKSLGKAPQTVVGKGNVKYNIEFLQPGFKPYSESVAVNRGEAITVNLQQRRQKREVALR